MDHFFPVQVLRFLICQFLKDVEWKVTLRKLPLELLKLGHRALVHTAVSRLVMQAITQINALLIAEADRDRLEFRVLRISDAQVRSAQRLGQGHACEVALGV
jgi:hypothetical protein